jgi:GH24 family phage-related lysozyme (muramidase)
VPYKNRARRAFGPDFDRLSKWAQDALTSLVYNRGASMVGPARVEMRFIRDVCLPLWKVAELANQCIARKLREMVRIWAGSKIAAGMHRRRNDEANLALFSR